ncbi:Endo-1,4-beta-xylanase A precursor [Posidoniimonas polymericola]|uniref:Beta-xylanase n=1 Tax=Posidoniimonas polymericola TaxID=2528002 RepID=A0A5C5YTL5_9BACT|nr:endo-1,4-beta-xylanase [Posidoniimonas polymericola]TWT78339.1 Endo-1,4-beta-xylanase A precursor [Posidoniimonas polymericola]
MFEPWSSSASQPNRRLAVAAVLVLALLSSCPAAAQASQPPVLKDAFAGCFSIGAAVNRQIVGGSTGRLGFGRRSAEQIERDRILVTTQFNSIAPENDLKWALIHPQAGPDGYQWGPADAFVEFGERHGMYLVGHTLVWHSQTPLWVFQGDGPLINNSQAAEQTEAGEESSEPRGRRFRRPGLEGPRATREQLLARMRDHIHTVVSRYRGRIKAWDVVNEALSDRGEEVLRESLWREIIGPDYIAKAFEYAHEADPDAVLRYNDYGLEDPAKRRKLIKLVRSLKAEGAPVMAIGTQAHLNVSSASFENMDRTLTELETLGLPIHVTELDINSARRGQRNTGADISGNVAATEGGLVDEADRRLAEAYEDVFRAFLKHREKLDVVTFWGANDANSWRSRGRPLLFDGASRPKPAFDAVLRTTTRAD